MWLVRPKSRIRILHHYVVILKHLCHVKAENSNQCTFLYSFVIHTGDIWLGYRKINGTWQWLDGSVDVNPTLISTTVFDSQPDTEGECVVHDYSRPNPDNKVIMIKKNCYSRANPLCIAPLQGNANVTLLRDVTNQNLPW